MSNGEDPAQSGGNVEDTNPDDNANPPTDPMMDHFNTSEFQQAYEAYFPPGSWPFNPASSQDQQDEDISPPAGPSVEGFENSQVQQAQNNAESTNPLSLEDVQDQQVQGQQVQGQQAQDPPGNIDQGETFTIPSVIDLNRSPCHGPYEVESDLKQYIFPSKTPDEDLFVLDEEVRRQIQQGQNSPNNSNPGETRPISSIMSMDRGRSDGPYDPH